MTWITARSDNPLFTYEMRVRTRSGRWFDWLCLAPLVFAAVAAVALAYPLMVDRFALMSPFHFFGTAFFPNSSGAAPLPWTQLASLLLLMQCYWLGLRGPVVGQDLIARDLQRGTWGFILLSPLTIRQIFWGKLFGQTFAFGLIWLGASLGCLVLYGLSVPLVGLGPALGAWLSGQLLAGGLFALGVGVGVVLATFPLVQMTLRGISALLFVVVVGLSVYAQFQLVPFDTPGDWHLLALRLGFGGVYAVVLTALLFWLAQWRLSLLRRRDIVFGDGAR